MIKIGKARTQAGAKRRVAMKRALREKGYKVDVNITNKALEKEYREKLHKVPPSYEKYKKSNIKKKKNKTYYPTKKKTIKRTSWGSKMSKSGRKTMKKLGKVGNKTPYAKKYKKK